MSLQGQWRGTLTDQSGHRGYLVLNLDGSGNRYAGTCYVFENQANGSGSVYSVRVDVLPDGIRGQGSTIAITDPLNNRLGSIAEASAAAGENWTFPMQMSFSASLASEHRLSASWLTSVNTSGTADFERLDPRRSSELKATPVDWAEFKRRTTLSIRRRVVFRGQSKPWRLRTAFHRAGRADVLKFATTDIEQLRREVSGELSYLFPHEAQHDTALMALAQHHEYPTPLLDWTRSPYVAAYFACRKVVLGDGDMAPRVHELDLDALAKHSPAATTILAPLWTVMPLEPLPIHNPRVIPQQSLVTFCNIDDMEEWIMEREAARGDSILRAFDISSDAAEVMADLRLMGIHAGSLFPGLDGICRSLAEKNFMREPKPVDVGDVTSAG